MTRERRTSATGWGWGDDVARRAAPSDGRQAVAPKGRPVLQGTQVFGGPGPRGRRRRGAALQCCLLTRNGLGDERARSSTGLPISSRRRAGTGIATTACSPRITSSGPPSRRMTKGNVGKLRDAAAGGHAVGGQPARGDATGDCCDLRDKPRSHDTSRIAWAKLLARVGEEFSLECPNCGGDIRLIAFITEPGPIRKILTYLGEPLEPPPVSPARGPPADWGEPLQIHDDRDVFQASPDELPAIDIHSV